jgi:hypothetical protein
MRRRTSIGIALLALLHFALANASAALAQAGSTGGIIGKQDKSISGDEEADRPRAVPHPKRPAAKAQERSSANSCSRIVGTWSWYRGVTEMTFLKGGTLRSSTGAIATWTCTSGRSARSLGSNGSKEQYTVSQDGKSMFVTSTWGGGVTFTATRRSGDTVQ